MDDLHVRRMADKVERTGARVVEQAVRDGVSVRDLQGMKLRWYAVGEERQRRASAVRDDGHERVVTETSVYVYDEIGGSMGVSANRFKDDLNAITSDVIHLRINSPGGSVKDALAIMNTLRAHPAHVHSHIDGFACSAASIVMLGGDEITVEPGGEVMTHNASTEVSGEGKTLRQYATWLDRQSQNVAELYAQRTGMTTEEWLDLMDAETWFYGREAVDIKLADRANTLTMPASTVPPVGADDGPEIAERMARRHVLKGYRYASRDQAGAPRRTFRQAGAVAGATARNARRVPSEVRDAGQLRRRAMDRGLMSRSAPAGVTTSARRSAPAGDIAHEVVELRGRTMFRTHGNFTVYDRPYEMWDMYGPYFERVHLGAGAQTLAAKDLDCVFLLNHTGTSMARTSGPWNDYRGTLNLRETESTGWHEAFLNINRTDVRDMIEAVDDRTITEMSYAFMICDGRWNDDQTEYGIYLYDMHRGDVSAVNYGANPFTDVSARASEILGELEQMPAGAIREAIRILGQRVDTYERLLREADPGALARVVEPAMAVSRDHDEAAADREKAMATDWTHEAFQGALGGRIGDASVPPAEREPDPDGEPEQDEQPEIIDKAPGSGRTVAAYEALLQSFGDLPRP